MCELVEDEPRREALGEAARKLAIERYSWPEIARRLEAIYERVTGHRARRGARRMTAAAQKLWRNGWVQGAVLVLLVALALLVFWWQGPDWGDVWDAFRFVEWEWIVLALALNVVSTMFRALSWSLTIGQALPEEHHPRLIHVFSAFGVGLFANAVVPGRLGELARVAILRRHLPDAPPGTTVALVGTVFAHRLFDLVPATDPRRLGAPHRRGAALGGRRPAERRRRGVRALHGRRGSARVSGTGRPSARASGSSASSSGWPGRGCPC